MNSKTITGRVADLSKDGAQRMAFEFLPASALPILAVLLLWGSCPQTSNAAPNNTTPPFTQAPPIGADTSAEFLLVIDSSGGLRFKNDPTQGAYDGSDDTLVAVQNNSTKSISAIPLHGFTDIFGFDGDGLATYVGHSYGPTGYEGPGTSFSNLSPDFTAGIVRFNPPIPPGGSAYFSLEDALINSCPGLTPPTRLLQADTNWASTKLGNSHATIGSYGCYLTSAAMMINYHAARQFSSFRTDPAQLDTYLTSVNGFDASGNVIAGGEALIAKYARNNELNLRYTGMVDHRDDFTLDQYLCNSQPPVIYVGNPHWVLCTGQTNVNGTDTYSTEDPDSYPNGETLLGGFNDTYAAIDTYSDASGSLSGLYFVAHSPIELVLTAPDGGQKGINPTTGTTLDTIPASGYKELTIVNDNNHSQSLPKIKRLNVVGPADGTYVLTIYGTGSGAYSIDIAADDANGNRAKKTLRGIAIKGSRSCFNIDYQSGSQSEAAQAQTNTIMVVTPVTCARGASIDDLINEVRTAGLTKQINSKAAVRLLIFLRAAKAAHERGDNAGAINNLNGFIQAVSVYAGKTLPLIPSEMANSLISDAQALKQ